MTENKYEETRADQGHEDPANGPQADEVSETNTEVTQTVAEPDNPLGEATDPAAAAVAGQPQTEVVTEVVKEPEAGENPAT